MLEDMCVILLVWFYSTAVFLTTRYNTINLEKSVSNVAMTDTAKPRKVVFVFPGAAGHVNPSLPVCRRFIELGWEVP